MLTAKPGVVLDDLLAHHKSALTRCLEAHTMNLAEEAPSFEMFFGDQVRKTRP